MLSIAVFVKKSQCSCPLRVPIKVIRVAMAETLETSQFTSVQRRIQSLKEEAASKPSSETTVDSFLSPLKIDEKRDPVGPYANQPENVAATNISKLGAWEIAPYFESGWCDTISFCSGLSHEFGEARRDNKVEFPHVSPCSAHAAIIFDPPLQN